MDYTQFVHRAKYQDSRNMFALNHGSLDFIPVELQNFYKANDPVNVEYNHDGVSIHFYSVDDLVSLQKEYAYVSAQFIFATCNGDPIFLHDGCFYTCAHGVTKPDWELLANDFGSYLASLLK